MGSAAPHSHAGSSVERIMLQVCLALLPATVFGLYLFGWPALLLWSVTCARITSYNVCYTKLLRLPGQS